MSDHATDDGRLNSTGYCIDHPQIRVRRPNANGMGSRTILKNGCPLCAIHPVKSLSRRGSRNSTALARDVGSRTIFYQEEPESTKSYCSASDITETTVASSQSSSTCNSNLDDFHGPLSSSESSRSKQIVCRMHYIEPKSGREGSYTGQISTETKLPDGIGCLRLHDGEILDGDWSGGHLIEKYETQQRSKGYVRHLSRSRREFLSETLSRSCRLGDDDQTTNNSKSARHPSRSRRSISRSYRFDEDDEDSNSIDENNSLGSHGDRTVGGSYSARESKSSLPRKSSGGQLVRRASRYCEVKR